MKKVLLFLLTSFFSFGAINAQNLLLNGGFENWDDATHPTSWNKVATTSKETTIKHGGDYSVKHVEGKKEAFGQTFAVTPEKTYKFTVWFYVNNGDGNNARIWCNYIGDSGTYYNADEVVSGPGGTCSTCYLNYKKANDEWHKYEAIVTIPDTISSFYYELRAYGSSATVYWDDLVVEEYTPTGTLTLTSPNGGETYDAGDEVTLTWTSSEVDNVKFEVLSDEGWDSFIEGPVSAALGELLITIPPNTWDWDGYKIRVVDYTVASINDESDATFTINGHDTELLGEDFSSGNLGDFEAVSLSGDQVWTVLKGKSYAKMSGYVKGYHANEDWLISPAINLEQTTDEILEFYTAAEESKGAKVISVKYSTDYDGQGDPSPATWTEFDTYALSPGSWEWTFSGYLDLSSMSGDLYVAFIYTSTNTEGKTWKVTDIFVSGINDQASAVAVIDEKQVKILPNPLGSVMNISTDKEVASVVFFNMVGQIANKAFVVNNTVSTANLTNGMYIVQIIFADGTVESQKVIKR